MTSSAGNKGPRSLGVVLWLLVWWFLPLPGVEGYVIPPEQLLDFAAEHVVGFESLGLTLEHQSPAEDGTVETEVLDVWFRPPEEVRFARDDEFGLRAEGVSLSFLSLFCGRRHLLERFLLRRGLDLDTASYTRLDREPVYRVGRKGAGMPVLLLEKSRFVPLLLRYEPDRAGPGERAEIRFEAYERHGEGWFPQRIRYRAGSGVTGSVTVRELRLNVPFSGRAPERTGDTASEEKKRLESVIRAFENKYEN